VHPGLRAYLFGRELEEQTAPPSKSRP